MKTPRPAPFLVDFLLAVVEPRLAAHQRLLTGAVVQQDVADIDQETGRDFVAVGKNLRAIRGGDANGTRAVGRVNPAA